jgi:aryl-alcohol dehydrogenase-like predicted oxidoreductase
MAKPNAAPAGRFKIGGEAEVTRLGYGSMRLTGDGIWGPPQDVEEAKRVLRRLPELGIDFIDTADSYGPYVAEDLIAESLHPYKGMFVATKGGLVRYGKANGPWPIVCAPDYLRQCVQMSLRRLKVERIDLWQLHRIDPKVPRDEQFGVIREFLDQGLIRFAGLSMVTVDEIEAARKIFPVATVQNRFSLAERVSDDVVDYCEREGIGFIPYAPLAAGNLAKPGSLVDEMAQARGATPGQIALAWVLKRSPVMLPIFGTSRVAHLEENVSSAMIDLSDDEYAKLDVASRADVGTHA